MCIRDRDNGVQILIAANAVLFLIGTQIDIETTKFHSKFVFKNPNQTDACGCGESVTTVSYTHLDVYKRQAQRVHEMFFKDL